MKGIYGVTTSKFIIWNIFKTGVSTVFKLMVKLSPHPSFPFLFLSVMLNLIGQCNHFQVDQTTIPTNVNHTQIIGNWTLQLFFKFPLKIHRQLFVNYPKINWPLELALFTSVNLWLTCTIALIGKGFIWSWLFTSIYIFHRSMELRKNYSNWSVP